MSFSPPVGLPRSGSLSRLGSSLLLAALLFLCSQLLQAAPRLSEVERALPEFDLASVGDGQWQNETLEGKVWVINFWATWCPPCVEEIPSMNQAWQVLEEHGVGMLAINAGEGKDAIDTFLGKIPIEFPVLLGDADTLPNWAVSALPTTIVVNAEGEVVYEALGPREWHEEDMLAKILELQE